jgi:hypothetical protein
MAASAALGSLLNLCMLLGIAWSSPLFMTVGTLLTIPASILADRIEHDYVLTLGNYIGIVLIVGGFLGLTFAKQKEEKTAARK